MVPSLRFRKQSLFRIVQLIASFLLVVLTSLSAFLSPRTALAAGSISGTVFDDTAGTGASSGTGITGLTMRLYNSAGTFVTSTTTGAGGAYSFASQADGTYYITVQAPATGGLAEQTYGAVLNGDVGSGPICVGATPIYTQQSSATPSAWTVSANGPCYGGRRGATADTNTATLTANEHVARIVIAGAEVSGVDFGFSYNVVTNVNDAGQGSLRQFIANANGIAGANVMRFVPAVATNDTGSGGNWWKVSTASVLPAMTDANTIIDGVAYSNADGTTVLDTNSGNLENATVVGTGSDQATIAALAKPELEVNRLGAGNANTNTVFEVAASNVAIQHMSITGGSESVVMRTANVTGLLVKDNALGVDPGGTADVPLAGAANGGTNIAVGVSAATCPGLAGTKGLVDHNLMRAGVSTLGLCNLTGNSLGDWVVQNNFMRQSSLSMVLPASYYVGVASATSYTTIKNNLVTGGVSKGIAIRVENTGQGTQVIGNTITANGDDAVNIANPAGNNLVRGNVLTNNATNPNASGVDVVNGSTRNRISQNVFGGNSLNAIDLGSGGVNISTACVVVNLSANGGLGRPIITAATLMGTTLTVSGTYCNSGTYDIEFYKAAPNGAGDLGSNNQYAGEGATYVGTLTSQNGGMFTNQTLAIPAGSLTSSDSITAIIIRTDGATTTGNTSEFSANFINTGTDFGDAPDSYKTLLASNGPRHSLAGNLFLGTTVDNETDGAPSVTADGDDLAGTTPDDEDGVSSFPTLATTNTSYSVNVTLRNTSGSAATLVGWIDFNRDGTFQSSEGVSVSVPNGATSATLTWSGLSGLVAGQSYARLRLSTGALTTSTTTGLLPDGEVEDYPVTILASATSTPTATSTATGTATATNTATSTSTPTNTPTSTSTQTNIATPIPTNTATPTPTDTATATSTLTPTASPTDTATASPTYTATATSTDTATASPTDTATPTASPTGTATTSPTHTATPTSTNTATSTPTDTATSTASPTATPTATVTDTPTPVPTTTATPTTTDTATAIPTDTTTPTATTIATPDVIPIAITGPSTDNTVTDRTPVLTGTTSPHMSVMVSLDIDNDGTPDVTYMTMSDSNGNWSIDTETAIPTSGTFPLGGLSDGPVGVTAIATDRSGHSSPMATSAFTVISPTVITLLTFTVQQQGKVLQVQWATGLELNTLGFHLYRSATGARSDAVRVTNSLIIAHGGFNSAAYTWTDADVMPGIHYTYWLQEVELNSTTREHRPAQGIVRPTASSYTLYIPFVRR